MKKLLVTLLLMVGLVSANQASAQEILKHEVTGMSVEKATELLEKKITAKGLTVFSTIDQKAAAKNGGMAIKPAMVVVFGNPAIGTQLMNVNMAWTYELPRSIAVFEDGDGKVWLYTRSLPMDIKTPGQEDRIAAMNVMIESIIMPPKGRT